MSEPSRAFDAGFQPERTALAWRRTLMSLAAAFLAGSRILLEQVGSWSYAIAGVGLAVVAVLAVVTERRYRAAHHHLTQVDRESLPHDGALIAGAAAVTMLAGLAAMLFVFARVF